ncbi:DUF4114 domain-containing protein [filamentous cyanobacterium LEGE 11480]|uniref:DUF4114 domain-containing protein n=1 Tax=Romeriopsis navalis LEGE 11480 TaxID=2777977 RepID=A0A928VNT8_9CYAN|nr:DUF4114 domain-containing protein [Romeriopsis navalis]MBE9029812.1 DUF4114 domain-containing protein [Romeriopsis navalis LEGE 11480]
MPSSTSLSVGPINSYVEGSTWFDMNRYDFLSNQERVGVNLTASDLWLVDASKIKLASDYAPRVAFLNEGAGYRSPINISAEGETFTQALLFEDLSGTNSVLPSADAPLDRGDWVQLSNIAAGSQLNFSVIPNGVYNPGAQALSTDYTINPDTPFNTNGPVFWTAYADPETATLVMAFEDIAGKGTDNDFNDGILAIDIGEENFNQLFASANLGQDASINLNDARAQPTNVPYELEAGLGLVGLALIVGHKVIFRKLKQVFSPQKQVDFSH